VAAPQHKTTAPALEALKQRVIQLVELQGVLQQSNEERNSDLQGALADLKQLTAEHDQLTQELARLREENDRLLTTLQKMNGQVETLKQEKDAFSDLLRHHPVLERWIDAGSDPNSVLEKLLAERQELTNTCHDLTEERDGLIKKLGNAEKHLQQTKEALHHIFPKEPYRERRPDLESISDDGLVEHFTYHGIHEGVALDYNTLREALLAIPNAANHDLAIKMSELETLIDDNAKRLSFMNDFFIRLSLEGNPK
jgi:DNA repair exonuclease SbcCD ATPase subunit